MVAQSEETEGIASSTDLVQDQEGRVPDGNGKPKPPKGPIYVARLAFALVQLPKGADQIDSMPEARKMLTPVEDALRAALDKDPRVSQVYPRETRFIVDNARTYGITEIDEDEPDLLKALTERVIVRFNDRIIFRLRVPAKNQPKYRSMDDVPADEYLVIWDGVVALVQWDQPTVQATGSGGHIVFDVLNDAGASSGYPVQVIACAPGCHHKFVHADLVTFGPRAGEGDVPPAYEVSGQNPVGITLVSPFVRADDDIKNADRTYGSIVALFHSFVELKSLADSVLFLEAYARAESAAMMEIAYQRAARKRLPHPKAVVDLWRLRGSRRTIRRRLAGLWLALADIEARERAWQRRTLYFEETLNDGMLGAFRDRLDTGQAEIQSLDVGLVRATLENTSQGMEARMLVLATVSGAAAALGGAGITAILTSK